jgi:DNA-binding LacI/PurR family transcriptional regulator
MTEKPKLETVAREAGVSPATVSQVMRGAGRISEETRKKVLQAAARLNYVPDGRAAAMRSGQTREIGLLIHRIANPFNAEVISGVSDHLETLGFLVSVLDSQDDAAKQRRNLEAFIRNARAGILWVPAVDTPRETCELLLTHRLPTVTFLRRAPVGSFDHLGIENEAATAAATHYLADLGHRRIAYFCGLAESPVRRERVAGYLGAMAERGLGPPVVWDAPDVKLAAMDAMIALRQAHPEVTALVSNGDMAALGACAALARLGLAPGKDLSVIGFDDVQDAAIATPPLTTLAVSPYQLGRKLARTLIERIQDPEMPVSTSLVPAHLVVRATTAAPPDPAPRR